MMVSAPYNPYIFGPPIKDPKDFFGRKEELFSLRECIQKSGSVSVVGERRIGKTSLLYHLISQAKEAWPEGSELVFVFIDPQLPWWTESGFYARVMQEIGRQRPAFQPIEQGQGDATALIACLERITPQRLVLAMDEFEIIALQKGFSQQFFLSLRALAQNYGVSIITASSIPLEQCCAEGKISSVFRNMFQSISLGPFNQEEFAWFIRETSRRSGVNLEPWRAQLLELSGRFPAFTQLACSEYYKAAAQEGEITPETHRRVRQDFEFQARACFEDIWERYLSDEERAALKDLVSGQVDENHPVIKRLTRKGYVGDGRVFSAVFQDMFLREGCPSIPSPIWLDEKGEVWVQGEKLAPPLTRYQYRLLKYLCERAGTICTKDEIVEAVWSSDYIDQVDDQRIAKLISRLRERIEPDPHNPVYLLTIPGRGFRLTLERR